MKISNSTRLFIQFIIVTFIISWSLWSPFYFNQDINEFWALFGAWGPTISAIIITAIHKGKPGVKQLLKKLTIWRIPFKYYAFAILFSTIIVFIALVLANLFFGVNIDSHVVSKSMGIDDTDYLLTVILLPVFYLINVFVGGPIAEELGWRGFAQEELQQRYGIFKSGFIIGAFWVLWHLPLMLYLPKGIGNMPIIAYSIVMILMSMLFAWLYNKTNKSVLLAILFHAGLNFENSIIGAEVLQNKITLTIYIVVLFSITLYIILNKKRIKN